MSVRSGFVLVCCLVGTYLGCAGKSESELEPPIMYPSSGGDAGSGHAGKGANGGKGGTGASGGTGGSTTGTGGTRTGAGGGSQTGGAGGSIGTGGSLTVTGGGPSRGGAGGTGGDIGTGGGSPGGKGGTAAQGGRGGSAGAGFGGAAGRAATGGGAGTGGQPQGGTGGQAGSVATGGSAGSPIVPSTWTCSRGAYADGTCDCGCGATDSDCTRGTLDECARCNAPGSCGLAACPGRIDGTSVTKCLPPPSEWTCGAEAYADGSQCDCGCGAYDPDCEDHSNTRCDTCNSPGACGRTSCPSSIDPDDNSKCSVPALWTCDAYYYGDGLCNCGCGATDIDCSSTLASQCWDCPWESCSPYDCSTLVSNDNAHCKAPPYTWNCPARLYHDLSQCDCGCGAFDPDCASLDASACDTCNDSGSCSKQACPGTITSTETNWYCTPPTPPESWKCPSYAYGDGFTCDCGCGAPDPDCATNDVSECVVCPICVGVCPTSVDSTDTTRCAPPPTTWTCDVSRFGDFTCDCGCGALDVDCYNSTSDACYSCPAEGCSAGVCSHIEPTDNSTCSIVAPSNWTCSPAFYADSVCDCGCGAHDPDCSKTDESVCVYCNSTGSCSTTKCPGTILPNDNTACSQ